MKFNKKAKPTRSRTMSEDTALPSPGRSVARKATARSLAGSLPRKGEEQTLDLEVPNWRLKKEGISPSKKLKKCLINVDSKHQQTRCAEDDGPA
jgi:hypothetical protein